MSLSFFQRQVAASKEYVQSDTRTLLALRRDVRSAVIDNEMEVDDLVRIDRKLQYLKRRDWRQYEQQLVEDTAAAWARRDHYNAHRLARKLAKRKTGPRKRFFDTMPCQRFSARDWSSFCSATPDKGGFCSTELALHAPIDFEELPPHFDIDLTVEACEDFALLGKTLRKMQTRKTVPNTSLPVEIWRILWYPQAIAAPKQKFGVGYDKDLPTAPAFKSVVIDFLFCIRRNQMAPKVWHEGTAFTTVKNNKTEGIKSLRIIGLYDSISKGYYRMLWARRDQRRQPFFSYGYQKHKSRDLALLHQRCLEFRLRRCGISFARIHYDSRNAFFSPHRSVLLSAVRRRARVLDTNLLVDRLQNISLVFGQPGDQIRLGIGRGFPPGDSWVAELFLEIHNPCVEAWIASSPELAINGDLHWIDSDGDRAEGSFGAGVTTYADDAARSFICLSWSFFFRRTRDSEKAHDNAMLPTGFSQNYDKQHLVPFCLGTGSKKLMRRLFRQKICNAEVVSSERWLGFITSFASHNWAEIYSRKNAVIRNFKRFGNFWHKGPYKLIKICFRSLVLGCALAGLESMVLSKSELRVLEVQVLRLARSLLRGKAGGKATDGDGATTYSAMPDVEIYRWLGSAPLATELQIGRLRMWQRIMRAREDLSCLHMVLYGNLDFDVHDCFQVSGAPVPHEKFGAVPWLRLFYHDLLSLDRFDDLAIISDTVRTNFELFIRDPQVHSIFLEADFQVLRARTLSVQIPPPGLSSVVPPSAPLVSEDREWLCILQCGDGTVCDYKATSLQKLVQHQVQSTTLGGEHGVTDFVSKCVLDNVCFVCKGIFASKLTCTRHVQSSQRRGFCITRPSAGNEPKLSSETTCPVCQADFPNNDRLKRHLRTVHFSIIAGGPPLTPSESSGSD